MRRDGLRLGASRDGSVDGGDGGGMHGGIGQVRACGGVDDVTLMGTLVPSAAPRSSGTGYQVCLCGLNSMFCGIYHTISLSYRRNNRNRTENSLILASCA